MGLQIGLLVEILKREDLLRGQKRGPKRAAFSGGPRGATNRCVKTEIVFVIIGEKLLKFGAMKYIGIEMTLRRILADYVGIFRKLREAERPKEFGESMFGRHIGITRQ